MFKRISCDLHDYFESVCVRKNTVQVALLNGQSIEGIAVDIVTKDKQELLRLNVKNQETTDIPLLSIKQLSAVNNVPSSHNFTINIAANDSSN